ncbi:hypothetical protein CMI37_33395 [Candidatus Pacearchaeota archaeon]|nr:hypothetical protein [Candidatus Pacearchaeota archaeon]
MTTDQITLPEKYQSVEAFLRASQEDPYVFISTLFKIRHRDSRYGMVPMIWTKAQADYWPKRTMRDQILKARQIRISSQINAEFTAESMLTPNINTLFVCQMPEETHLPEHRDRVGLFVNSVHKELMPCEVTMGNQHRMEFTFANKEKSVLLFAASGSHDIGQGMTLNRVHITECAAFQDSDYEEIERNLLPVDATFSRIVKESRPRGARGKFYDDYQGIVQGDSVYKGFLYEWWWEPSYQMDEFYLGSNQELTEHETRLMLAHGLTKRNIAWRRYKIKEVGSEDKFLEQFCEDDVTCFLFTGFNVFDITYLTDLLSSAREPVDTEYNGKVSIYLGPQAGSMYVIGVDPAEGMPQSDDTTATVRKLPNWEHAAAVQGKIPPREAAGILATLGRRYNNALINVENNNAAYGLIDLLLREEHYPYIYIHQVGSAPGGDGQYGFHTGPTTKPWAIGLLRQLIADRMWRSWHPGTLRQMRAYQELEPGKFGGKPDDLVSAELIAIVARNQGLMMVRSVSGRTRRVVQGEW